MRRLNNLRSQCTGISRAVLRNAKNRAFWSSSAGARLDGDRRGRSTIHEDLCNWSIGSRVFSCFWAGGHRTSLGHNIHLCVLRCELGSLGGGSVLSGRTGCGPAHHGHPDPALGLDPRWTPLDPNDFYVLLAISTRVSDGFDTTPPDGKTASTACSSIRRTRPTSTEGDSPSTRRSTTRLWMAPGNWIAFFGQINDCPSGNAQDKSVCSVVADSGATGHG